MSELNFVEISDAKRLFLYRSEYSPISPTMPEIHMLIHEAVFFYFNIKLKYQINQYALTNYNKKESESCFPLA